MRNRSISFLLCLMMIVSLFAGCLTSASAADLPGTVTVNPAQATIPGTGSATFTAVTAIDGLSDQIKKGNNIDLSKWLEGLQGQGFDLEQLTGLLSESGFDWDTIVKSLEGAGFNINDIASMFASDDGSFDLSKVFSDLAGDNETLSSLLKALNSEDGKQFDVSKLSELLKDAGFDVESILGKDFDLNSLIGKLTDLFGGKKADTLADDEPAAAGDSSVTDLVASKLMDSLSEKYGDLFTQSRKDQLQQLFDQGKSAEEIISQIPKIFGKDFDLTKTVEAIFDATDGKFDIAKIVEGLSDAGVPLDKLSEAIGNSSFGDKLDLDKLTEALTKAMNEDGSFDLDKLVDDLTKAMGDDFDPAAIASSILEKAGIDTDSETLAKLVESLQKAADGEETDLDLTSVVDAIMAKLPGNEDGKLNEVIEALEKALEGTDSEDAQQSIIDALKNQIDTDNIQSIIDSLKDSMGEDFDPAAISQALSDALGTKLDSDMITKLIDAIQGSSDENSSSDLQEIVNALMGGGASLSELIEALKGQGINADGISDLLVGGSLTYKWYVRDGKDVVEVSAAKDKNTYSGADTKTLEVSRATAPKETETYTYFCTVSVDSLEASLNSSDVTLTILPAGEKPDDGTTPDDGKTDSNVPVLDNENHIAYIHGYGDDTVRPGNNITRAEAATIFYNLMTADSRAKFASTSNSFPDVKKDAWYNGAVSTLARASVLQGYEDGTFQPNKQITRAEMATILTRFEVLNPDVKTDVKAVSFKDVSASYWAASYIKTAADNGWINGYPDGTFKPGAPITRAETVTMVNRMLNRNPQSLESMIVNSDMIVFKDNADKDAWYFLAVQEAANGHDFSRDKDGFETWTAIKNAK